MILPADKGKTTVVMDTSKYQTQIEVVLVRYMIPTIFIDTWIWFDIRYFRRKLAQNI